MVEVETCFWSVLSQTNANKTEGKFLQDNDQTGYELWSRTLVNQEAIYAQNGYSRYDNIEWMCNKL